MFTMCRLDQGQGHDLIDQSDDLRCRGPEAPRGPSPPFGDVFFCGNVLVGGLKPSEKY